MRQILPNKSDPHLPHSSSCPIDLSAIIPVAAPAPYISPIYAPQHLLPHRSEPQHPHSSTFPIDLTHLYANQKMVENKWLSGGL